MACASWPILMSGLVYSLAVGEAVVRSMRLMPYFLVGEWIIALALLYVLGEPILGREW